MRYKKNENINVLLADDDATTRFALRLLLLENLYTIVGEAADGEKAVELCTALKPHIAVLDFDMPKLNGNQAAQRIRERHPEIGIIVVSAVPTADTVRQAMQAGACSFIVKPFSAAKLMNAIDTWRNQIQ